MHSPEFDKLEIPSDEHNQLVGDLVSIQDQFDDRTAALLIKHGRGDTVDKFMHLTYDELNHVTLRPSPDDPDYSSEHLPDPLTEEEIDSLISEGAEALASLTEQ